MNCLNHCCLIVQNPMFHPLMRQTWSARSLETEMKWLSTAESGGAVVIKSNVLNQLPLLSPTQTHLVPFTLGSMLSPDGFQFPSPWAPCYLQVVSSCLHLGCPAISRWIQFPSPWAPCYLQMVSSSLQPGLPAISR